MTIATFPARTESEFAELGAPQATGRRVIPSAGHGYTLRYSQTSGQAHALDCQFCLHTVYPHEHRRSGESDVGAKFRRARAAMIAHVFEHHPGEFAAQAGAA